MFELNLENEADTVAAGEKLGELLVSATVIYLEGVLGAGKTTFCRGVLQAFGYEGHVKSPTYTLVEPYHLDDRVLYHFDLYRLGEPEELEYMGIRDYFAGNSVCLIEWPSRGMGYIVEADIIVKLAPQGDGRKLTIAACNTYGESLVKALS